MKTQTQTQTQSQTQSQMQDEKARVHLAGLHVRSRVRACYCIVDCNAVKQACLQDPECRETADADYFECVLKNCDSV